MNLLQTCCDIEEDQIRHWLSRPNMSIKLYAEPQLEQHVTETVKFVCHLLKRSNEVFIAAVDILENYVNKKVTYWDEPHSLALLVCAINVANKLLSPADEIQMKDIEKVVLKLTDKEVDKSTLNNTELEILVTVDKISSFTTVTDLCMLLEYYVKNLKLKVDVEPLCLELLNLVYISRKKLFDNVKTVYSDSADTLGVFKQLVCNKFYYAGGIITCALQLTKLKVFLNIQQIVEDIAQIAQIHFDHIILLAKIIREVLVEE